MNSKGPWSGSVLGDKFTTKEAFIYRYIDNSWTLMDKLTPSSTNDGYGYPVTLSHDGTLLLVSAFYDNFLYIYGNA